ncbi:hypothetical protein EVA_09222 [gut metagenome]|uniref:Uncharacterized protein n=1 Tax=gut metagenome TaxID=749906 RepID=J9GKN6_9ZZZZ
MSVVVIGLFLMTEAVKKSRRHCNAVPLTRQVRPEESSVNTSNRTCVF